VTDAGAILFCRCIHRELFPPGVRDRVLAGLAAAGRTVTVVDDLCGLAAGQDASLRDLFATAAPTVVACYPRAVRWLLHRAGLRTSAASPRVFNMRTDTPESILAGLDTGSVSSHGETALGTTRSTDPWIPWFPVIDYDRCVNCRQCVSFCPFGVYTTAAAEVVVTNPRQCKDNCPACARACPQQAIIFPKVPDEPINGAEVTAAQVQAARQRVETQRKDMAGGDIHGVLAQRKLRARLRAGAAPDAPRHD
jgi:NAD-dependent dihydropyrimidine dehydrogenase PreA subunit